MENNANMIEDFFRENPELRKTEKYETEAILLKSGELASKIWYIKSGIVRLYIYSIKYEKFVGISFFFPNDMIIPFRSFTQNIPSMFNVEVVENAILYAIDKNMWQNITNEHPEFSQYIFEKLQQAHYKLISDMTIALTCPLAERYEEFMKNENPLIKNVKQKIIAEHFCTSPEALSRALKIEKEKSRRKYVDSK